MNTDKLIELERKWRASAAEYLHGHGHDERAVCAADEAVKCADELAATLRAEQAVGEEQIARELLADCLQEFGCDGAGYAVRHKQEGRGNLLYPAALRAIRRALGTTRQSEGVVLVPREPTEAMVSAMAECYDPTWGYPNASIGKEWAQKSYAAMLAAAPGGEGMVWTGKVDLICASDAVVIDCIENPADLLKQRVEIRLAARPSGGGEVP